MNTTKGCSRETICSQTAAKTLQKRSQSPSKSKKYAKAFLFTSFRTKKPPKGFRKFRRPLFSWGKSSLTGFRKCRKTANSQPLRKKSGRQSTKSICSSRNKESRFRARNTVLMRAKVAVWESKKQCSSLRLKRAKVRTLSVNWILNQSLKNLDSYWGAAQRFSISSCLVNSILILTSNFLEPLSPRMLVGKTLEWNSIL